MLNQQKSKQEQIGRVFSYKPLLGFGFIYFNDGESVFFHKNDSQNVEVLSTGDEVKFTLATDFKGRLCAKDVRRIAAEAAAGAK
jgi:cold shock CspA family protein